MAICPLHPETNQGLSKVCRKCGALIIKTERDLISGVKGVVRVGHECLALKKKIGNGRLAWDFPGGRIEKDETPEEALRREIKEELPSIGDFSIGEILGTYRFMVIDQPYPITFYKIGTEPFDVVLTEEHTGFRWVNRDTVGELQTTPDVSIEPGFFQAALKAFEN